MSLKTCRDCGNQVSSEAPACPNCGRPRKDLIASGAAQGGGVGSGGNVVAGIASFVVPGLGQLAQGRVGAGFLHFFAAFFLWFVALGWIVHIASAVGAASWNPRRG